MCRNVLCNAHVWSITLPIVKNSSTVKPRGDQGSLGHGVQWDSAYIGNSKKENAIMTLSNKCQRNPHFFLLLVMKESLQL